jgi:hypothetical protein
MQHEIHALYGRFRRSVQKSGKKVAHLVRCDPFSTVIEQKINAPEREFVP